jgi:protoporphyrinogen/coproporphyrinogen III oxidase
VKRVVVIGAGVSGLAAAYRLAELSSGGARPLSVRVLEGGPRAGGAVSSRREGGFLLEEGPDSFLTEKPWLLDLCKRLGLEGEVVGTNPGERRSFIAWQGRLVPTPEGFYLLAPTRLGPLVFTPLLSWRAKARAALEPFVRAQANEDESLGSFVRRRFGAEVLERIAQPLAAGVYGASPDELSLRATFPRFLELEAVYGSVLKGLRRSRRGEDSASGARYGLFASLRNGMETLVQRLVARLPRDTVSLNAPVRRLERAASGWKLTLASGESVAADAVCLATPAWAAADLLEALDAHLAVRLRALTYGSMTVAHFAYPKAAVGRAPGGFGFVVPACEKRAVLGCTFSHAKFPGRAPEDAVLLRAFVGDGAASGDAGPLVAARRDLTELLGLRGEPLFTALRTHPRSMPRYHVGHLDLVSEIMARVQGLRGLELAGNAYHGVGLPDCVRTGERAAERIFEGLFA